MYVLEDNSTAIAAPARTGSGDSGKKRVSFVASPRSLMPPPALPVAKGAAMPTPEERAAAEAQAQAAAAVVGNGDNGETEIHGREAFSQVGAFVQQMVAVSAADVLTGRAGGWRARSQRHASYADEIAAANAEQQGQKLAVGYGSENVGKAAEKRKLK